MGKAANKALKAALEKEKTKAATKTPNSNSKLIDQKVTIRAIFNDCQNFVHPVIGLKRLILWGLIGSLFSINE